MTTGESLSRYLVAELGLIEGSPWSEYTHGKPLTKVQLAKLLEGFSIFPKSIRSSGGSVVRGYDRVSFGDAWERYLASSLKEGV
jgi:hypothetical protein